MTSFYKLVLITGFFSLLMPPVLRAEDPAIACECDSTCREADGCDSLFSDCCSDGFLESLGIDISGYMQQSINTNSRNPTNPPTGAGNWPGAGWTYRNDEYMLNRMYLSFSRTPDTSNGQWDIGGAVDVLYGTDYQFLQSRGLETHGDFTNK
jgi:hypothetical protein